MNSSLEAWEAYLIKFYFMVSSQPGWLSKLIEIGIDKEVTDYLADFDDTQRKINVDIQRLKNSFAWEVRTGLLECETDDEKIARIQGLLAEAYDAYERSFQLGESYYTRNLILGIFDEPRLSTELTKLRKSQLYNQKTKYNSSPEYFEDHEIESARSVPMESLITHHLSKSKRFPCPYHQGQHNNMTITPKNFVYCFVCHAWADPIKWVMDWKALTFPQAIKYLTQHT